MKKFYTVLLSMLAFACISMSAENLGTKYTGNVTISLDPTEPIVVEQSVYLKPPGTGLSTFALYDFKLDPTMPQPMGNIVVENVTTTNVYAEGSTNYKKYVGSADGIKLDLEGSEINASAQIEGYESIDGTLAVTINVIWHMDASTDIPIPVSFEGQKDLGELGQEYFGEVGIILDPTDPISVPDQKVYLRAEGGTSATFGLYNFKLDPTMPFPMGDIVVPVNVATNGDHSKTYTGSIDELYLTLETPNDISASATINGTETEAGALNVTIGVTWHAEGMDIPFNVTFKGTKSGSGAVSLVKASKAKAFGTVGAINVANCNGTVKAYTLNGSLAMSQTVNGNATINMPAGIYLVVMDGTACRVVVK